ncbi:hypothetical protein FRC06_009736, partial [Ceratobasidium sp. 370]
MSRPRLIEMRLGSLEQYASRGDLQTFFKQYAPGAVTSTFTTELVNGGLDVQTRPGSKANLSTQYGSAITYPTPNIFYSTGGRASSKPPPTRTNE